MKSAFASTLALVLVVCLLGDAITSTQARYLPTRSGKMDRLDKLRELLKELLESEIAKEEYNADAAPKWHPESRLFYKREAQQENPIAEFTTSGN